MLAAPTQAAKFHINMDANFTSVVPAINFTVEPKASELNTKIDAAGVKLDNLGFLFSQAWNTIQSYGEKAVIGAVIIMAAIVYMKYDNKLKTKYFEKGGIKNEPIRKEEKTTGTIGGITDIRQGEGEAARPAKKGSTFQNYIEKKFNP